MPELTVILCTHSPHRGRLERTLEGLKKQTLAREQWEFLLIDNASAEQLADCIDLSWHPHGRVVRENTLGLTNARLCGIRNAAGNLVVWVDDDNIFDAEYLSRAQRIAADHPRVGAFAGRVLPEFECPVEPWFTSIHGPLGLSDHGASILIADASRFASEGYPAFAPCGAGLCTRLDVLQGWRDAVTGSQVRRSLGRTGANLSSGEDNDIVLTALKLGRDIGYFPELSLTHIMPAGRLTAEYHARLLEASNRTWVLTLGIHGISPWAPIAPWTVGVRKLRAAVRIRPWQGPVPYLRWKAACGQLAGRSDLWRMQHSG